MHAERHSDLVMCVPASQKPMHAAIVSPPPGVLGADSLGLALVADDEGTVSVRTGLPPLDSMISPGPGDRGAMAGACTAGAARADGGNAVAGLIVL